MDISRRDLLKFSALAGGGTLISSLGFDLKPAYAVELSRFSGRVNTEVYSVSPSLGRGKLPPRSGGVKGNLATQVSHAAAPWRRSKLMGDS